MLKIGEYLVSVIPLSAGMLLCWLSLRPNPPTWILPFWYQQLRAKGADESGQLLIARATSFVVGIGFIIVGCFIIMSVHDNP